jgi:hypothetical protein
MRRYWQLRVQKVLVGGDSPHRGCPPFERVGSFGRVAMGSSPLAFVPSRPADTPCPPTNADCVPLFCFVLFCFNSNADRGLKGLCRTKKLCAVVCTAELFVSFEIPEIDILLENCMVISMEHRWELASASARDVRKLTYMQNEYSQSLVFQPPLEPDHLWHPPSDPRPPPDGPALLAGRAALGGRFGWPLIKRPEKR